MPFKINFSFSYFLTEHLNLFSSIILLQFIIDESLISEPITSHPNIVTPNNPKMHPAPLPISNTFDICIFLLFDNQFTH